LCPEAIHLRKRRAYIQHVARRGYPLQLHTFQVAGEVTSRTKRRPEKYSELVAEMSPKARASEEKSVL